MKRHLCEDSNHDAMNRYNISSKRNRLGSEPNPHPTVQSAAKLGSTILPSLRSLNVQLPTALHKTHFLSRFPSQPQMHSNHAGKRLRQLREKYLYDVCLVYQTYHRAFLFISNLDDIVDTWEKKKLEHGMSTLKMLLRLLQRDPKQLSARHVPYLNFIETQIKRKVLPLAVLVQTMAGNSSSSINGMIMLL